MASKKTTKFTAAFLTLVLLLPMAIAAASRPRAKDAQGYHERAKELVDAVPYQIGDWYGKDQEVTKAAKVLLKPNVILNRQYRNIETHRRVTLLLVHCRDARDMSGHYPPVCYPNHGWDMKSALDRHWQAGDMEIEGKEYQFALERLTKNELKVVMNFMILPDGGFSRDMKGLRRLAADYSHRHYGAGQVQVLIDATVPEDERNAIFTELVGALDEAIAHLLAGDRNE